MASITMMPAPQDETSARAQRIMQMGLAIKQQKEAEAQRSLEMGFKLMDLGIDPDYQQMMKAGKILGYPLPSDKQQQAQQMTPTPQVEPNQAAKTGASLQNIAGAQAGNPPSKSAAQKAPGGGVIKPEGAASTQNLQSTVAGNNPAAPQPQQGGSPFEAFTSANRAAREQAAQVSAAEARSKISFADLQNKVFSGKASGEEIGTMMLGMGMQPTTDTQVWLNADGNQRQQIIDIHAGAETQAAHDQRVSTMTLGLINSPQFGARIPSADRDRAAVVFAETGALPSDIQLKPDLTQIINEGEIYTKFAPIIGHKYASKAAAAGAMGISPMSVLPTDIQSLPELQEQVSALNANASWLSAKAQWAQAQAAMASAEAKAVKDPKVQQALDVLAGYAQAQKLGADIDSDIITAAVNDLAQSVGWTTEQKKGFISSLWQSIFGGETTKRPGATAEQMSGATGTMPKNKEQLTANRSIEEILRTGPQDEEETRRLRESQKGRFAAIEAAAKK